MEAPVIVRSHRDAEDSRRRYEITDEDLGHLRHAGQLMMPGVDDLIDQWYEWLKLFPEWEEFFSDPEVLARVKGYQREYWEIFLEARVDDAYIKHREQVGETHARLGVPLDMYFPGMNHWFALLQKALHALGLERETQASCERAIGRLTRFDTGIVAEAHARVVGETLQAQSQLLAEMSTPVTQIWEGILMLPVVGIIDSKRAQDIMATTLTTIGESQARVFILDISGVAVVDTAVANHLIKITQATRLMGCESTISGVSPAIAQTIVELGVNVGSIKTTATLRDALSGAYDRLGITVSEAS